MQDPAKTICDMLVKSWDGLNVEPRAEDIEFRHGRALNNDMRFASKRYAIEIVKVFDMIRMRTRSRDAHYETVAVEVLLQLNPVDDQMRSDLMVTRQALAERVSELIRLHRRDLADIRLVQQRSWRCLDEIASDEPMLRSVLEVTCHYSKS